MRTDPPAYSIDLKREFIGGVTTFLTMSYIVVLNPTILAGSGTGMEFSGVVTATVLLSFFLTLMMGLFANLPFAVAPGLGINAFFAYTLILGKHVPWQQALGAVFWSGVLFLLASLTPLREHIVRAIPKHLRISAAVGIGLFLAFIGLKNMGLIQSDAATFVKMGDLDFRVLISILGFISVVWFAERKNAWGMILSIGLVSILFWGFKYSEWPRDFLQPPDFCSVLFKLDIWGALSLALAPSIVAMFVTDLFDSISTFVGVAQATGLTDDQGEPLRLRQGLIVDAWATFLASLLGTSSGTAYLESAAGMQAGARTGKASVVTAFLFLPCLFLAPLCSAIPMQATAPILVYIGYLMFKHVGQIDMRRSEDAIPAFVTILLIPLTFSITQGILFGILAHVLMYVLKQRHAELKPAMWVIAALSAILLGIEHFS